MNTLRDPHFEFQLPGEQERRKVCDSAIFPVVRSCRFFGINFRVTWRRECHLPCCFAVQYAEMSTRPHWYCVQFNASPPFQTAPLAPQFCETTPFSFQATKA